MSTDTSSRAACCASIEAATGRGDVPCYGTKPAYPSCPQVDSTGAGQGGIPPLHPPAVQVELVRLSGEDALAIDLVYVEVVQ